jgi:hypothetical protein
MQRNALSALFIVVGLVVGLIGTIFFYNRPVGLAFPFFIAIVIIIGLALANPAQARINRRNLWLLAPMLFFAIMTAIRADPLIRFLDGLAVLALGGLALTYITRQEPVDEATVPQQASAVTTASLYTAFAPLAEVGDAGRWLRDRNWRGRAAVAVVRGLVLALPVLVVFTLLLGAADTVFAGYVQDVWRALALRPSTGLIEQTLMILGIGWVATGALAYGLARHLPPTRAPEAHFAYGDDEPVPMESTAQAAEKPKRAPIIRMGIIESGIVLGLVDLLFGAFVLVQLAYFFGGEATIEARDISHAQYARSGFFELVVVSLLTLGLVLYLDYATTRGTAREHGVFRGLALVMVAFTGVMLVSAAQRMYLYEEAFGFTHLRVYTHVFMIWLGVLFGVFVLSLFRVKRHVFSLGVLGVGIGYLLMLNVMNVDLYIAERNIARYHEGRALDLSFLSILSTDAVPAIIPLHQSLADQPEAQQWTGQWLAMQLYELGRLRRDPTILSAHVARDSAWPLLDAARTKLPAYDPSFFRSRYSFYNIYATPEPRARPSAATPPAGGGD